MCIRDRNKTYLDAFNKSLDYAWENARDEKGLFHTDLSGNKKDNKKWLLTQAAMIEMCIRDRRYGSKPGESTL